MKVALLCAVIVLGVSWEARGQAAPRVAQEKIILRTTAGDIVLALYPDIAPRHVAQILKLVRLGVYDSTHFYRVHPDFVVQTGEASDRALRLSAAQKAAIQRLPAEFSKLRHHRGTLSMARHDNQPNSAETSFSILLGDAPHLDGAYTIFGEVEYGFDVLDEFLKVPREGERPLVRITIDKAEVADSAKALAEMQIASARPIEIPAGTIESAEADVRSHELLMANGMMVMGMTVMVLVGLTSYFLSRRIPLGRVESLILINVLIGGFILFVLLTPAAVQHAGKRDPANYRNLALAIFLGLLGMFKLLGRFEVSE